MEVGVGCCWVLGAARSRAISDTGDFQRCGKAVVGAEQRDAIADDLMGWEIKRRKLAASSKVVDELLVCRDCMCRRDVSLW